MVLALLAGVVVGRLTGDVTRPPPTEDEPAAAADGHIHGGSDGTSTPIPLVTGQSVSLGGYTLTPRSNEFEPGTTGFEFQIVDTYGAAVTDFVEQHEAPMHLFAVRLDLTGYQHVHPAMADDGTWTVDLDWSHPGPWRIITDFVVAEGETLIPITLGLNVTVPGDFQTSELPEPTNPVTVADFEVTMEFDPNIEVSSPLMLTVTTDGEPVELEPYLGAFGHLVVLRDGDLGFLHVHPDNEKLGDALRFWTTIPSPGDFRLFLDFKVDGKVYTAPFTLQI
ncbi:hypothetical protein FB566_2448 [Stackebrandtia endophytica]|uniref:Secreted protein n=1 Tax=Stackebrandtia endophytica TaxID=1496996 RepID=A0A543AWG5_9ACTN|nr:hypothetical protein FB566_2448 [Stackebrandtia endophytica]